MYKPIDVLPTVIISLCTPNPVCATIAWYVIPVHTVKHIIRTLTHAYTYIYVCA